MRLGLDRILSVRKNRSGSFEMEPTNSAEGAKAAAAALLDAVAIGNFRSPCDGFGSLSAGRTQLLQQRLRRLQIERVETIREPSVNRGKQIMGLLFLSLVAPKPR